MFSHPRTNQNATQQAYDPSMQTSSNRKEPSLVSKSYRGELPSWVDPACREKKTVDGKWRSIIIHCGSTASSGSHWGQHGTSASCRSNLVLRSIWMDIVFGFTDNGKSQHKSIVLLQWRYIQKQLTLVSCEQNFTVYLLLSIIHHHLRPTMLAISHFYFSDSFPCFFSGTLKSPLMKPQNHLSRASCDQACPPQFFF